MRTIAPDSADQGRLNGRICSGKKWIPSGTDPVTDSGSWLRPPAVPPTISANKPLQPATRTATSQSWSDDLVYGEAWGRASTSGYYVEEPAPFAGKRSLASDDYRQKCYVERIVFIAPIASRSTAILSALCGKVLQHSTGAAEAMAASKKLLLEHIMRNTRIGTAGAMWIRRQLPQSGGRIFHAYNVLRIAYGFEAEMSRL